MRFIFICPLDKVLQCVFIPPGLQGRLLVEYKLNSPYLSIYIFFITNTVKTVHKVPHILPEDVFNDYRNTTDWLLGQINS